MTTVKMTMELVNGTKWFWEGTYEDMCALSIKLIGQYATMIKGRDDPSFDGPTLPGPTGAELDPTTVAPPAAGNGNGPTALNASRCWTEQTVRKLWGMLYGEQAKLVKFLVSRDGKVSYQDLGKHMGYDGQHLSGILSPLTRNSQAATKDRLARLVDWRVTKVGAREYFIQPEALPFLKAIVS